MKTLNKTIILLALLILNMKSFSQTYTMPKEDLPHEGTWLQWPHQYEYGVTYRNRIDATWVAMTQALVTNEKVHIIAYDNTEKTRIISLLTAASISLTNVDFKIFPTNDVWARDNGPLFVKDGSGNLKIEDWGFNGWGGKFNYNLDNPIPTSVSGAIGIPVINLNSIMTVEGGAYELDGNGVFLACKSSIISQSPANSVRNPGMTQAQAETNFSTYLGVTKFIWLDGVTGTTDVTDFHIDGFAKFLNNDTLVTMSNADLTSWGMTASDITILNNASNSSNVIYTKVYVPLTQNNVITTYGTNLGYQGSYANYYVANGVVLVPNYNDPNDAVANSIIQSLYPGRTVIGIDVRNLYANGGMVHCVTQQQPAGITTGINEIKKSQSGVILEQNFPNPVNGITSITLTLEKDADCRIEIYNSVGQLVSTVLNNHLSAGTHTENVNVQSLQNGVYTYVLKLNNQPTVSRRMVVLK
jgi:agmatine deiminase